MFRHALIGIAVLMSSTALAAPPVYKFDADAINSSIKCELATVARMLARDQVPASRLIANVAINGTETTNTKVGAEFSFPWVFLPSANTSYTYEVTQLRGASGNRNINSKNKTNCRKSFIIDVGIVNCFQEQRTLFIDGNTITCSEERKATSTAEAKGKFTVWVVGVGPTGALSKTRVWKVSLTAPPEKKN